MPSYEPRRSGKLGAQSGSDKHEKIYLTSQGLLQDESDPVLACIRPEVVQLNPNEQGGVPSNPPAHTSTHLWIDSLCIIQDSVEDWQIESAQMGRYYREASLTLFATAASGDDVGFYCLRDGVLSIAVPGSSA